MIYKMFGSVVAGTVDSLSSLDIQDDGFITAILFNFTQVAGMDATNDSISLEASFMSSNTFVVNDTRGSIGMHGMTQVFLTSGGGVGSNSLALGGLMIPIEAGERVHMHAFASAGVTGQGTIYLYVEDSQDAKQRPKRRLR